jgi:hypothetical protein
MTGRLREKVVMLSAILLLLFYLGYRLYEAKSDAAPLKTPCRRWPLSMPR